MTMTEQHPITPPPELLKHWEDQHFNEGENYDVMLTQAYQAGADQELEACCEWADETGWQGAGDGLRTARRPKPPSLKEQALEWLIAAEELHKVSGIDPEGIIRRALEALPDNTSLPSWYYPPRTGGPR
jgi:hypothetical protein